jgi:hypothetical protein
MTQKKMEKDEARYVVHLDSQFTAGEVSSILAGITDVTLGLHLVRLAESLLGEAEVTRIQNGTLAKYCEDRRRRVTEDHTKSE